MPPSRLPNCRKALRRPIRPPNACSNPPRPRQFSQNSQLLLVVSSGSPRPQLPFLYPSSHRLPTHLRSGQWQLARLLTTERKIFIKETARLTVKFAIGFWLITSLASIASLGYLSERQERAFPSPPEWTLITRFHFRNGRWREIPANNENGINNWSHTYADFKLALARLENPDKDGSGLLEQEEGGILVSGVGKTGFDLSGKSEAWRKGYFEVLIGMARCAEHLEGWVNDKTSEKKIAWPPEMVLGPSNPKPKPPPPGAPEPPLEENAQLVAEPPETFYLKILTSKGFTNHQRLTAALGYADWLSFKGLKDSAEEMYKWGLDIACSGIPDPSSVINPITAVISASAPSVTPNVVLAATSLAVHHAVTGDTSTALPIFLSVLRARRSAPPAPVAVPAPEKKFSIMSFISDIVKTPPYPPLPPTGDEPLVRAPTDICEEAALMNYIGEIVFATSSSKSQRAAGLNWTREAVQAAAAGESDRSFPKEIRKKCLECEDVGLDNWAKMMERLVLEAREAQGASRGWKGWLGLGGNVEEEVRRLEEEEGEVVGRLESLRARVMSEAFEEADRAAAKMFVV